MAEPGDPTTLPPTEPDVDHDDLIGFSSAARLQGRSRAMPPSEPPAPEAPVVEAIVPKPVVASPQMQPPPAPADAPAVQAASVHATTAQAWATESPVKASTRSGRAPQAPGDVGDATGLYAVYALILFAVPTLGVSALVALLAVTGRAGPDHPVAASHFVFQQRTLWAGGVAAALGGILIAVGLGVFVLFIVAVWLILRGTSGVMALKAGRPVRDPRGWFLA
ncbi:hypothetical protein BZG35_15780 [Brevundimonas sp. LM2]|uniref:DUF4870 family protein n=1 Tax=Brevundimonas sp. LM2 TaxID=1938605 RepID=UPI000983F5DA|nr:hypothetical protein [Brevundimonas sp. LM2]AQR62952.1 hypothetical protein BZG35_15780 [Brevundimonas sp. LM2]